ncbi:MAG TPA: GspH/FimT family pseudopilin [Longimicrobiales bacterium]
MRSQSKATPGSDRAVPVGPAGFTLLEVVVVLILGAIAIGFAMPKVSRFLQRQDVQNARDAFVLLARRARATAVQRGMPYRVEIDPDADRAWVVSGRSGGGDTLEVVSYMTQYRTDVETSVSGAVTLCYAPRGFALESCGIDDPAIVRFSRAAYRDSLRVRPLGQVDRW